MKPVIGKIAFLLFVFLSTIALNKALAGQQSSDLGLSNDTISNVMLRISSANETLSKQYLYEGNNLIMRGKLDRWGLSRLTGVQISEKWRRKAQQTRKLFVLRDSLFSQQDNFTVNSPYRLLLPPRWITAALLTDRIEAMTVPDLEDDLAWAALRSKSALFGSFPPSPTMFNISRQSLAKASQHSQNKIIFVRRALKQLSDYATRLIEAAQISKIAMIKEGAEIISETDREYFGDIIRRDHIVPIFVENPQPDEIRHGKGLYPSGKVELNPSMRDLLIREIYSRRLADGDLALERYDLSNSKERQRAIHVLELIVPESSTGDSVVWLWVTGPMQNYKTFQGKNAIPYIEQFKAEVEKANINNQRLRFISKPDYKLAQGQGKYQALSKALLLYNKIGVPLGLNMQTAEYRKIVEIMNNTPFEASIPRNGEGENRSTADPSESTDGKEDKRAPVLFN
jgi:hypothetical protein